MPAFRGAGNDRGLSPIGAARESIGVSIASEKLAGKFFGNGAVLSGLIETAAGLNEETAAGTDREVQPVASRALTMRSRSAFSITAPSSRN